MKRWILFNLDHPRSVISILIIITALALYGLGRLHFDSSTEAVMPRDSVAYKMGQRAKEIFIDSKTFMFGAIEPAEGKKLFSHEVFAHIYDLVVEIEEFKDFNLELENRRLEKLISLGNIHIKSENTSTSQPSDKKTVKNNKNIEDNLDAEFLQSGNDAAKIENGEAQQTDAMPSNSTDIDSRAEADLDAEFLGGHKPAPGHHPENNQQESADIWDLSRPLTFTNRPLPKRPRRNYSYEDYKPVKLSTLRDILDPAGKKQLDTILYVLRIDADDNSRPIPGGEFKDILEKWEQMYLYKSMEIVKTFMNPITGEDIIGTEDTLKPVELVKADDNGLKVLPSTEADFNEYKNILMANPAFNSTLYSIDESGNIRALALTLAMKPQKDHSPIFVYFREMMEKYNTGPVVITPAGLPVFEEYIKEYMNDDLIIFLPLVFFVVILTFFLNFRLLRGVILPTVCLFLAMTWTMGLMGFFGIPITLVVNMLPSLLVAVASSYSIHIFNQYLHDHEAMHANDKKSMLLISMNHISVTVMLAASTTFIGFMTLTVNQITSLRDFGIFAAIGTILSMAISTMLIPSALMVMKLVPMKIISGKDGSTTHANPFVEKIVAILSHLSMNRAPAVVITAGIIFIISAIGLTRINVETGALYTFKESDYPYQTEIRINDLFNGTMVLNMIIDSGKKDGLKDPKFLTAIEEMREWIVSEEGKEKYHHLHTISFGDIIKRMHRAMNSDNPDYYRIPESESLIRDYLEIFSGEDKDSDGRIDSLEQFIDHDYRYTNVLIKTGNYKKVLHSSKINKIGEERIKKYMASHPLLKNYKFYLVGEPVNMTVIADLIVQGQMLSVVLTLLIIFIIILLLFRNLQAGFAAIIPITVSITVVYGVMGYFNIPLDITKALLAALAIGIGVDDTIHMLKTLRHNLKKGLSLREAVVASHNEAGVAIVYTSLALIFGFTVLLFSKFVPIIYLGLLVTATMTATTISALLLLPAVIVLFKLPIDRELSWPVLRWLNLNALLKLDD